MIELYNDRLKKHFQQNIKYLTLVFNDFFVLAIIFLLGGFLFWYANALKSMPQNLWYYPLIVAVIAGIPLIIGSLVSLLKTADSYYLFTEDQAIKGYLNRAKRYSMLVPLIVIALIMGLLFPFATAKVDISLLNFAGMILGLVVAKYNQFNNQARNFYIFDGFKISHNILVLIQFLELVVTAFIGYPVFLVLEVVWLVILSKNPGQLFMWNDAIDVEEKRQEVVNGIFSLFTDIKDRPIKIKRRKYLDFLLSNKPGQNPDFYLFMRSMLRNPDSLGLVVRMTAFGILLTLIINQALWVAILDALVLFLTLYQLLPLYQQYQQNMMYKILPIDNKNKIKAFQQVVGRVMIVEAVILTVIAIIISSTKLLTLEYFAGVWVALIFLIIGYLPAKVRQLENPNRKRR